MSEINQNSDDGAPIRLWKNQPREETTLTLKLIRQRAQDLRARTRKELLGNLAIIPITIGIGWFGFVHTQNAAFQAVFVVGVIWSVLGQILVHKGMWRNEPVESPAMMSGLEFYRREIERRRNLLGRLVQWNLGPILLSMGALIVEMTGIARNMGKLGATIPFTFLAIVWVFAWFALRSQHQKQLKSEIEQLNEIERAG